MKFNAGFSTDKAEMVPLPATLFRDVLPDISSISELKVTLQIFWLLSRQQTFPRYVDLATLQNDAAFLTGLRTIQGPRPALDYLSEGLELAVARGTLLEILLPPHTGRNGSLVKNDLQKEEVDPTLHCFLINTERNRRLVSDLLEGRQNPAIFWSSSLVDEGESRGSEPGKLFSDAGEEKIFSTMERDGERERGATTERVEVPKPNIFGLYEQNIGMLTPLIVEQLGEAESTYPPEWITEAFNEAVSLNKRNWRYVQRILENWAIRGKDDAKDRRYSNGPLDPDKYKKGKYAHLFRRK